jgi:hypothetical protein
VIQPRPGRREERRQRQREQRKRMGLAGGSAAVAIGLIIALVLALGVHHVVTNGNGSKRTQATVLFQVQGSDRTALASVLLAHDSARSEGLEVFVPSRLITDVCGYGSQNFGNILALPNGETASRTALSSLMGGVTIDGSWVLSTAQLAKLVDGLGGITTDVTTNVIQRTGGGGGRILVAQGPNRHLNGAQAVEYATYQAGSTEGAVAQLARLQNVLDGLIAALPKTVTSMQARFRSLGRARTSTLSSVTLAKILLGIAADESSDNGVYPTDLPVTAIETGAASPSYRANTSPGPTGIPNLVSTRLKNSVPKNVNSQHATVFLLNGTGQVGLVGTACPKLAKAGFTYVGSDNAPSFSNAKSEVEIFSNSTISQGKQLARALGLPLSDVRRGTLNQDVAKFVVILGGDYKP